MKRKIAAVFMTALLVCSMAALTGCGDNNSGGDMNQTPNADENLDKGEVPEDRSGSLGEDIRRGADDLKDDAEDILDGDMGDRDKN